MKDTRMIKFSELLIFLFAASLPVTYVLLMRHYFTKNEAEDLANLRQAAPPTPDECCCETAAKALAGRRPEARPAVLAH